MSKCITMLEIELAQRQEDIRELREERDLLKAAVDKWMSSALRWEGACTSGLRREEQLKAAIEAMRTAGGSEEFQIAFDRAKELASAL